MKNRLIIFLFLLFFPIYLLLAGSNDGGNRAREWASRYVAQGIDSLSFSIELEDEDGIYIEPQQVSFRVHSTTPKHKSNLSMICLVATDTHISVDSLFFRLQGDEDGKWNQKVAFTPSTAGFYRISIYLQDESRKSGVKRFNVGYNPEQIVSVPDAKSDFFAFWEQTKKELNEIAPRYKMRLLKEKSSDIKNMYHVEMYSLGNVKIEGYYSVPKKGGKHPTIIRFQGYGAKPRFPDPNTLPDFNEFILSVRGQGIQKEINSYGEWILNGLHNKEMYYYRGAYMDLIRGVDFLSSRPEVDQQNIMAEGGSQGGAFTLFLCGLDKRIRAAAPRIPFMSDFRDYFDICAWPRSLFEKYLKEHPDENWDRVYDLLSYFDVKNIAGEISCPIIMGVGLQDETCPPHTNFAGYNLIRSKKSYIVYPKEKHSVDESWWREREIFFREHLYKEAK